MRIVVLGDFHLHVNEYEMTEKAIEDINTCSPDLVVPLGDFGCNASIGGVEGLREAYRFLSKLNAPLRPILGNHDMQRETGGKGEQPSGTMERAFLELYGLDSTNGVIDTDEVRLIFVGTDLQPPDSCYIDQECYVTDDHFDELEKRLRERGDTPVIVFTHAPPAGAGLRTVPRVHVRATNAYLDQNHKYDRWIALVRQYPQIRLWFSAHYHLGHDYPDSRTERHGTTFFMTGVHGSCTRDQTRQSRVIDLDETGVRVTTLDHVNRKLRSEPDWMADWSRRRPSLHAARPEEAADADATPPEESSAKVHLLASCAIGDESALPCGLLTLPGDRCLVSTTDGFLWEISPFEEAVLGTLHLGLPLSAAAVSADGVWRAWDRTLVRSDPSSLWRYQRYKPLEEYPDMVVTDQPIGGLAGHPGGGVWAACGRQLRKISLNGGCQTVHAFADTIGKLIPADGGLYVLTVSGVLFYRDWDGAIREVRRGVIDWHAFSGITAGILDGAAGRSATVHRPGDSVPSEWPVEPGSGRIVLLDDQHALWNGSNGCYLWNGRVNRCLPLSSQISRLDAFARFPSSIQGKPRFCLAVSFAIRQTRPQLQIWECGS